jgi:hypothetical protein
MTTALTELMDAQREELIVLLIAIEIVILLYEIFLSGADDWFDPAGSGDFLFDAGQCCAS